MEIETDEKLAERVREAMLDEGDSTWTLQGAPDIKRKPLKHVPSLLLFSDKYEKIHYLKSKLKVIEQDDALYNKGPR